MARECSSLPVLAMAAQAPGARHHDFCDFLFKMVLLGDSGVGKTCVVRSFQSATFSEEQHNTIGVDFTVRTLDIDNRRVKVQVWDTAGQERFRTVTQSYYRSAHGAMITYDLTCRSTFDSLPYWVREVEQYGATDAVLILVGNKSDLELQRQVLFEEACALAERLGALAALETSAKQNQNVEEAFVLMSRELMARSRGATVPTSLGADPPSALLHTDSHPIQTERPRPRQPCDC